VPFIDLNKQSLDSTGEEFDVVVIGAGAAGILLAVSMTAKGQKVLLVESGHFEEDQDRQSLNTVRQTGKQMGTAVWGRKRAIGGTTIAWGGQSLPFSPLDLSERPWVANSGWPIPYEDIERYYLPANRFMNIDGLDYEGDVLKLLGMSRPEFDAKKVWYHFSKWAPEPNFRKLYTRQLSEGVTVLYNAVLSRIDCDGSTGRVRRVQLRNFEGAAVDLGVKTLILATGGIETNRILLSNNHQYPKGLGGGSDWLGKCFMEHPCLDIGKVVSDRQYRLQSFFNTHIAKRRKYSIRLSLAEQYQRSHGLLNGSASIMFAYPDEESDPYLRMQRALRRKSLTGLAGLIGHARTYALGAGALLRDKLVYKHGAESRVVMMLEQEPLRESSISLSDELDRFGTPLAKINWVISEKTWNTVLRFTDLLVAEFGRLGIGRLAVSEAISAGNLNWQSCFSDVNHHMGGTRLSASPANGVVNPSLQVWGHDNLFVCSSSVYPTGSHSNPTLTLLALSLRLVDFLNSGTYK